jgi:hypothetical protein
MIVAEDRALKTRFNSFFGSMGYSAVQYVNPLKAIDNLDELAPDILICNAMDYPRHWKLLVKHIRDTRDRNQTVVILAVDDDFDTEEANKAAFLGVNLLYPQRLETVDDFRGLDERIRRYKTPPGRSRLYSWVPGESEPVSFIFNHPLDFRMISGRFSELSPAGGIFRPDETGAADDLEPGMIIEGGSIKAGESILSLTARIISNKGALSVAFVEFAEDGFQSLLDEMSLHSVSI